MKKYLLPAALALALHLLLLLVLVGTPPESIAPDQRPRLITLFLLQESKPEAEASRAAAPEKLPPPEPKPEPDPVSPKMRRPKAAPPSAKPSTTVSAPEPAAGAQSPTPSVDESVLSGDAGGPPVASAPSAAPSGEAADPVSRNFAIQPIYQETPAPKYPEPARRMGHQGTVELKVLVTRYGVVAEAHIVSSSGYPMLDKSAMAAVRGWRFKPGEQNGSATEMWIKIPLSFQLH